ncbi:MAG TPA: septal ring lytic transglycosylase RlpA family protein [Burkholderiaceae bacterium]|nr:septal ring lytic transglycosylase RlpA family protein [Burkholderiaceae bacterium]
MNALRSLHITMAVLLIAACASTPKESRFYAEDGPPAHVPPDLQATPDAVPRDEPFNPNANRPYVALGRTYVPDTSGAPFRQHGIASWYGRQFQGNRTASGERYDMFAMTAAHPTLPIPSYARVTSTRDGRSVIVRINDRGPFLHDRIIDLSYAAAARLGLATAGSGEVEVERIVSTSAARASSGKPAEAPGAEADEPVAVALPVAPPFAPSSVAPRPLEGERASQGGPAGSESVTSVKPASQPQPADAVPRTVTNDPLPSPPGAHWSVQLGAFKVATNAEALRDRLALLLASPDASSLPAELRTPRVEREAGLSRVLIGEATERAVATQWSRLLERYLARPTALFVH